MGDELSGPALKDLQSNLGASFEEVSSAFVLQTVSHCIGALMAGLVFRCVNRSTGTVACLLGMGIVVSAVPWQRQLIPFLLLHSLLGIFISGLDVACNTWILDLWQESANPWMQGLHFVSATARSLALLSIPAFVASPDSPVSHIFLPYSVVAVLLCSAGLLLLISSAIVPYLEPSSESRGERRHEEPRHITTIGACLAGREDAVPGSSDRRRHVCLLLLILLFGCLLMSFASNVEHLIASFISPFASDLGFGNREAALAAGVFQAAYAVARLIGAFVAIIVKPDSLLVGSILLSATGCGLMLRLATCPSSHAFLWAAVLLLGIGNATVYASVFSLMEQRIDVSETVSGLLVFSSSLATIAMTIVLGSGMQDQPFLLIYLVLGSLAAALVSLIALWTFDRLRRRD